MAPTAVSRSKIVSFKKRWIPKEWISNTPNKSFKLFEAQVAQKNCKHPTPLTNENIRPLQHLNIFRINIFNILTPKNLHQTGKKKQSQKNTTKPSPVTPSLFCQAHRKLIQSTLSKSRRPHSINISASDPDLSAPTYQRRKFILYAFLVGAIFWGKVDVETDHAPGGRTPLRHVQCFRIAAVILWDFLQSFWIDHGTGNLLSPSQAQRTGVRSLQGVCISRESYLPASMFWFYHRHSPYQEIPWEECYEQKLESSLNTFRMPSPKSSF